MRSFFLPYLERALDFCLYNEPHGPDFEGYGYNALTVTVTVNAGYNALTVNAGCNVALNVTF